LKEWLNWMEQVEAVAPALQVRSYAIRRKTVLEPRGRIIHGRWTFERTVKHGQQESMERCQYEG
jgi:hypothetical protein